MARQNHFLEYPSHHFDQFIAASFHPCSMLDVSEHLLAAGLKLCVFVVIAVDELGVAFQDHAMWQILKLVLRARIACRLRVGDWVKADGKFGCSEIKRCANRLEPLASTKVFRRYRRKFQSRDQRSMRPGPVGPKEGSMVIGGAGT